MGYEEKQSQIIGVAFYFVYSHYLSFLIACHRPMIDIRDEKDCVGCNACVQICPRKCITMHPDELGFNYPAVNQSECIDCHLCERVCPVINRAAPALPLEVFAAKNPDDAVRLTSSSGGVFHAIASHIISEGGIVFGARFDKEYNVVHGYAETSEELKAFQGSKYVQSDIGDSFRVAEKFLKSGRRVLFTGTPCHIAALRLFLRKDYGDKLVCADVVCHGVPGPEVWRAYLDLLAGNAGLTRDGIRKISFRDKRLGWRRFGLAIDSGTDFFEPLDTNLYIRIFLRNLDLRPSCYDCPAKCGKSHSDITLADFWKLRKFHNDIFDSIGVSLLMVNTTIGSDIIHTLDLDLTPSTYAAGLYGNPAIEHSSTLPSERKLFIEFFRRRDFAAISALIRNMENQ